MNKNNVIKSILTIAEGLEELLSDVVFVGGSITQLYVNDDSGLEIRPTLDIDCIIEITSRKNYHSFENKIREKGFSNVAEEDAPICRWKYNNVIVDIMPTDENILGFSNKWYLEGIENAIKVKIGKDTVISILSLPYFILTKLEAFLSRGKEEGFRYSQDIEDILVILDGQKLLENIFIQYPEQKIYIKKYFDKFIKQDEFIETIYANVGYIPELKPRADIIIEFLKNL